MKLKKIHLGFVLLSCLFINSCYYDNEEELYGDVECDTSNVTYTDDVLPVMEQNCYVCHAANVNQGGITLEGYDALKVYVDNGRLLGAINHDSGFSPMPQNAPKLPDCAISKIQAWVDDGAPNN